MFYYNTSTALLPGQAKCGGYVYNKYIFIGNYFMKMVTEQFRKLRSISIYVETYKNRPKKKF